jgi:type I restriction enzyme, S subunit
MTSLARYTQYKPIDARWLREIPASWKSVRLRYLCDISTGSGDTQDADPSGSFPFVVRSPTPLRSSTYSYDTEAILTAGDGALVGKAFLHLNGKFHAHQRVYVLTKFGDIDARFLYHYFSSHFRLMASDGSAKTTVDSVRRWMLTDMPVAVPPANEQVAIADFLNRETTQIDALIARQNSLIEIVRERLAAVLTQHFQSSEGKRPATVRQVLMKLARPAPSGLGVVTAYRDGVVTLRAKRREDGYTFSDTEAGYQEVFPGDIVFHALDGFAGAVGVADSHGVCTPVYHVCGPKGADDPEYIALLLRYLGTSGFLAIQAPTVRQRSVDFRNWSTFARVPLMLPSASEQQAFMSYYHARKASADALVAKTRQHIEFAKERRAALISAAVTGQIDVTRRSAAS